MKSLLSVVISLGLVFGLAGCVTSPPRPPLVTFAAARPGTQVQINQSGQQCIVDVLCPGGIGWAEFSLAEAARPSNCVFRVHLKGLEEARFEHDGVTTRISVSSHGDLAIRESDKDERPVAPQDFVAVTVVSSTKSQASIPLEGWFEIRPPAKCRGDCKVRLSWIDFYR